MICENEEQLIGAQLQFNEALLKFQQWKEKALLIEEIGHKESFVLKNYGKVAYHRGRIDLIHSMFFEIEEPFEIQSSDDVY